VLFTRKQPRFEALRAEIEAAIVARSAVHERAPAPNGGLAEQLARLHASGALSDQEFDAAKVRLLG
jgi:Short C-terminal domain